MKLSVMGHAGPSASLALVSALELWGPLSPLCVPGMRERRSHAVPSCLHELNTFLVRVLNGRPAGFGVSHVRPWVPAGLLAASVGQVALPLLLRIARSSAALLGRAWHERQLTCRSGQGPRASTVCSKLLGDTEGAALRPHSGGLGLALWGTELDSGQCGVEGGSELACEGLCLVRASGVPGFGW